MWSWDYLIPISAAVLLFLVLLGEIAENQIEADRKKRGRDREEDASRVADFVAKGGAK